MSAAPVESRWYKDAAKSYLEDLTSDQRRIMLVPEGRRVLTRYDFKLFCMTYFRSTMMSDAVAGGKVVTLSEFHRDFMDDSNHYVVPCAVPAESRTAWVCPRESGKSTMLMMMIIWLAAHGHQRFVMLFSATGSQSEDMLANIRSQFTRNELLRQDFPELVTPATRRNMAMKLSDNKTLIIQSNGFICSGRGIDSSVLGTRVEDARPSMIVLDDIEGGEENYSQRDAEKRLVTLQDDILPLGLNAHVIWVGTTTRPGGLTEQLVHHSLGQTAATWVVDENFRVHYRPALVADESGTERSMWPERWPLTYLLSQRHMRSFRKNFLCLPAPDDYAYWRPEDFAYGDVEGANATILTIDPAVSTKRTSDETGIAVLSYSRTARKVLVRHCEGVRLAPVELRQRVLDLLELHQDIAVIYIEVTQGGNTWESVLHDMPVKVRTTQPTVKKELRAQDALNYYQRGAVVHEKKIPKLEDQMIAFPNVAHDDLVDAVGMGVLYFLKPAPAKSKLHAATR